MVNLDGLGVYEDQRSNEQKGLEPLKSKTGKMGHNVEYNNSESRLMLSLVNVISLLM